jgi:hypothetical protein
MSLNVNVAGDQKSWKVIITAVVTLIAALYGQKILMDFSHNEEIENINSYYEQKNDSTGRYLARMVNELGEENATLSQNLVSEKTAKELLKEELKDYKKVNSYLQTKVLASINDLKVGYNTPPGNAPDLSKFGDCIPKDSVMAYFMAVPQTFNHDTSKWYGVSGVVQRDGVLFSDIHFNLETETIIGTKKRKAWELFKSIPPTVDIKNLNPYATTVSANNIVIKDERDGLGKIATSRWAVFGYGVIGGFALNSYLLRGR